MGDRWRSIRGGEGYKKPKEDEGEMGQRVEGKGGRNSPGEDERKRSLSGFTRRKGGNLGSCPLNMPPLRLAHPSFCL